MNNRAITNPTNGLTPECLSLICLPETLSSLLRPSKPQTNYHKKKKPNKGMRKPKLNFGSVYGAAIPQPHAKCHQVMLCSPRVFPWPANM